MSSSLQDFLSSLFNLEFFGTKLNMLSESMLNSTCSSGHSPDSCRDDTAALPLKLVALASILVASMAGIAIPLVGRRKSFLATDGNLFIAAKAFAAGVILATGFVHMLPDATENLTDPCLPKYPWRKFPFSGFIAMMAALLTLLVDFVGTQVYEKKSKNQKGKAIHELGLDGSDDSLLSAVVQQMNQGEAKDASGDVVSPEGCVVEVYNDKHGHRHGYGHSHAYAGDSSARNIVVAQVLELGIVSHSVLIGLSIGVSHSPCTIKPLIVALSFHQFFEGFALGGCIAQARFKRSSTIIMACFFTLTTPGGIAVGLGVSSSYNPASVGALVVEGVLDSISSGILIYMALVDLIATDFMSNKMRSNSRLQLVSFGALFLGATLMALLGIWS